MLLIDYARTVGVPCGGLHVGRHVGWTTDAEKAATLQRAGAVSTRAMGLTTGGRPDPTRAQGFEISFAVGAEALVA